MSDFSLLRFARAFGRPLLVGGALVAAYALLNREPRAQGVVLAGAHQAAVEAAVRDLRPVLGDVLDTLDVTTPGVFRLALRVPARTRRVDDAAEEREQFARLHVAQLYWSVLRRELGTSVGDTVRLSYRRGTLWDSGLPGVGRRTGWSTFSARAWGWRPWLGPVYGTRPGA
jgi:hypothetical protein